LAVMRDPTQTTRFDENTWDRLIRHAEASGLLGRLGALAHAGGFIDSLPKSVAHHLQAAYNLAEQQRRSVRWELHHLGRALRDFPGRVVLLKCAAYVAGDLAPAAGRLFSDIDLLVPKALIEEAESRLMLTGWISSHHDAYDQRYYREWMHELPPMRHLSRGTVLDLHHSILPETARIKTRPDSLLADAIPLPAFPGFHILEPADQVLHSATHLFHEGEWEHGLRDLVDLDALLRVYANQAGFWERLLSRASTLNLGRPLYYALRYAQRLLSTPVPETVMTNCPSRPPVMASFLMDAQFLAAFSSAHPACRSQLAGVAQSFLYVRSHWLRMPASLLLSHLIRKAWKARINDWKQDDETSKNEQERRDIELR
jgi:hypothetical protein